MSYEVPTNESRMRKLNADLENTRQLARFIRASSNNVDTSADGYGSTSNPSSTKFQLSLYPEIHYVCVDITYAETGTITNPIVIGDEVSGNGGWKGRLLHKISSTRGVFESTTFPEVSFNNVNQTLTKVTGGWQANYTTAGGNYKKESIVIKSATAIIDSGAGNPTIKTIYGASKDGQLITLLPVEGKTLTLQSGDNIDVSSDVVINDQNIAVAQFHNRVINSTTITDNKWKLSTSSGSGGGASALAIKEPCRVATILNYVSLLLVGEVIDGVTVVAGDRILVKAQTTQSSNGIYVVDSVTLGMASLSRATDFDNDADVTGSVIVAVQEGTTNADTLWMLTTNDPITIGATNLTFVNLNSLGGDNLGNHIATTALKMNNNIIWINGAETSSIRANSDSIYYTVPNTGAHWLQVGGTGSFTFGVTNVAVSTDVPIIMNDNYISAVEYIDFYASAVGAVNAKIDTSNDGKTINFLTNGSTRVNVSENASLNGTLELFGVQAGSQAPATFKTVNTSTAVNGVSIGELAFDGNNFSSTRISYGRIVCDSKTITTNSEKGTLGTYLKNGTASPASLAFQIDWDGSFFFPDITFNDSVTVNNGLTVFNGATIDNSTGANIRTNDTIFLLNVAGTNILDINTVSTNNIMTFSSVGNEIPQFYIYRNDTSPINSDVMGVLRFRGNDSTQVATTYGQIIGIALDVNNGSEDGQLEFSTITAGSGTLTTVMSMDGINGITLGTNITGNGKDITGINNTFSTTFTGTHFRYVNDPSASFISFIAGGINITSSDPTDVITIAANGSSSILDLQAISGSMSLTSPTINIGNSSASTVTINNRAIFNASVAFDVTNISTTYTVTQGDFMVRITGTNTFTITLPTAVGITGRVYMFYKVSTGGTVTIDANGSQTIDGALTQTLTGAFAIMRIMSDGTNWMII